MGMRQLAPWNWFRNEEERGPRPAPLSRSRGPEPYYPAPLARMREEFDRMFDDFFSGIPARRADEAAASAGWLRPSVDIAAKDGTYEVTAELPGVQKEDLDIDVVGDTLRIRGEKKQESEEKEQDYYCVERTYGSFQRQLSLPEDADAGGVEAEFTDGVLKVTIPRREEAETSAKRVEVKP